MTTPVRPVPRPRGHTELALSILNWRPWCDHCRPHAEEVADALRGLPADQIDRLGRKGDA